MVILGVSGDFFVPVTELYLPVYFSELLNYVQLKLQPFLHIFVGQILLYIELATEPRVLSKSLLGMHPFCH